MMKLNAKGVAIIIVIIVSAALMGIGFGISSIVIREIKISSPIDESVAAIMAADAGMERKLYDVRKTTNPNPAEEYTPITLPNGASFTACESGFSCSANSIKTQGEFRGTTRSWQADF